MTVKTILAELEALGNDKVRAHNTKIGAGDNQFGVKLGDIRKIAARIKSDDDLARDLWKTGNMEAKLLAILIIKPKSISRDEVDEMVRSVGNSQVADWLSSYVIKDHPEKESLRLAWMQDDDPWALRAGWSLTSGRVTRDAEGIDLPGLLNRIDSEMPTAAPEAQWTMNSCLASIGIRFPAHRKRALAIGEKHGVYRDYPVSKGCTSPFAPIWINEIVRRNEGGVVT